MRASRAKLVGVVGARGGIGIDVAFPIEHDVRPPRDITDRVGAARHKPFGVAGEASIDRHFGDQAFPVSMTAPAGRQAGQARDCVVGALSSGFFGFQIAFRHIRAPHTHLRDRLRGWGGRTRTSMCGEKIHLFDMSRKFGFRRLGADGCGLPGE